MPELVTTLVSTFRGQRDVAIGNLIGSSDLDQAKLRIVGLLADEFGIQRQPRRTT